MDNVGKIIDEAFNKMIAQAAVEFADEQPSLPTEESGAEHVFSEKHEKQMKALFAKHRNKELGKTAVKITKKAVCVIFVVMIVAGITVMNVDAWRTNVLSYIYESNAYTTVISKYKALSGIELRFNYIPEGFKVAHRTSNEKTFSADYVNEDSGLDFYASLDSQDIILEINTEGGSFTPMTFRDSDAFYADTDDYRYIVWGYKDYTVCVAGNVSKEELMKIAEGIEVRI